MDVLKLRAEFEQLDLSGRIVPETVTIDNIGFIADLRELIGHLWQKVIARKDDDQQRFAIKNLQLIMDYYRTS
jgi:hypothetical protein